MRNARVACLASLAAALGSAPLQAASLQTAATAASGQTSAPAAATSTPRHRQTARRPIVPAGPGMERTIATDVPDTVPHTLADALSVAYETNPQLTGERAHLRSTDENVPTALAGWRPTIAVSGSYGDAVGRFDNATSCQTSVQTAVIGNQAVSQLLQAAFQPTCYANGSVPSPSVLNGVVQSHANAVPGFQAGNSYNLSQKENRILSTVGGTVTQYLYRGGGTTSRTHEAVNSVYAERARLIAEEEQVFTDTITAYVTVVEDQQLLQLDQANEQVLGDELKAINDRVRVGELTRTDVAQAEAALAQAIATRQTAEGSLQTARATFVREVGVEPPADLADPQPLRLPVRSDHEAEDLATSNNPTVIAAKFNAAELRDAVDVAFSSLGPTVSLQGMGFEQNGSQLRSSTTYGAQATINLNMPLYQGGSEYAAVRAARQNYLQAVRQTEDAQRAAREQAVQAWETLVAARASIQSSHVAVRSSEIALEGVEREALVGSATTQNVLIQQQNLLSAQITLVQNVTSLVTASYGVASAIGRLTARDMGLAVPLYDETAYYNAVRDRLWGTGDHAIFQPGR